MKKLRATSVFECQQMEKAKEQANRKHIRTQDYKWKNLKL